MKTAVLGLGYVGSVMTGCLARAGHEVVGVDVKAEKVEQLAAGRSPVIEPGLEALIASGRRDGLIRATGDTAEAILGAEVIFLCVGTPSAADGSLDTGALEAVCRRVGAALEAEEAPRAVVIRSTVMPGAYDRCRSALEEALGCPLRSGGVTLCLNPEFLREGSAIDDFMTAPFTVIGAAEPAWAEPLRELYRFVGAPVEVVPPGVAEAVKLVCNAWHAAKVCFANEVGRLCAANEVDAQAVMELFVKDERLNLSARYLRPGFAYGGSCLPKDLGALVHLARRSQLELPLIEGLPRSNALHIDRARALILESGRRRVGFLGLSFKHGTDDLRGSPQVDLVEFCLGKGFTVRIYDPTVRPDRLVGRNRQVALERLGHLAELLVETPEALAAEADLIVIGHADPAFAPICRALPPSAQVLDLVGLIRPEALAAGYQRLC